MITTLRLLAVLVLAACLGGCASEGAKLPQRIPIELEKAK